MHALHTHIKISSKKEGIRLMNCLLVPCILPCRCVLALGEDNDFGIGLAGASTLSLVQLPTCIDDLWALHA